MGGSPSTSTESMGLLSTPAAPAAALSRPSLSWQGQGGKERSQVTLAMHKPGPWGGPGLPDPGLGAWHLWSGIRDGGLGVLACVVVGGSR